MGFGAVKIYDKAMKLIKKISAKQVSKTFWDQKFRKKDIKLKRDDTLYKKVRTDIITKTIKKKKARGAASKTK